MTWPQKLHGVISAMSCDYTGQPWATWGRIRQKCEYQEMPWLRAILGTSLPDFNTKTVISGLR